jgi:Family of unknown function (DUF5958)
MNVDEKISVNQYAQNLRSLNELKNDFLAKNSVEKRKYLIDLTFILLQARIESSDVEKAVEISGLKPSVTPVVKIKKAINLKGINQSTFNDVIGLPDNELDKIYVLFLSLYKVAYERSFKKDETSFYKWWLNDLSDIEYVHRIKTLHKIQIVIRKLYNNHIEIGAIISAILPFSSTIYEKEIIETQLQNYAFNRLYPNDGLNIYKESYDDTCSITVIRDINSLDQTNDTISIY